MEEEAPGTKERADRDIECSVRDPAPIEGSIEETEGFRVGDDRCRSGFAADVRQLTRGTVVAEKSFEAIDLLKGEIHLLFGGGLVGNVELDGEDCAHRSVGLTEVLEGRLRGQRERACRSEREYFESSMCEFFAVF